MKDIKRWALALLMPPTALMAVLVPISAVLLIGSMVFIGTRSAVAIVSYVLSAYTLTVWCVKAPILWRALQRFWQQNRYARRWRSDARLRVRTQLLGGVWWNAVFAAFQLWLGFYHHTFWYYSLGAYYLCLAAMRLFLLRHLRRYAPGERAHAEAVRYRACGWMLLVMNLALAVIVFFMLYWDRTFHHHMITAIAMAAYTFSAFASAVVSVVRYRRYNSPVLSASKAIGLMAACVSMLTLTATLLTAFDDGSLSPQGRKWLLGAVGVAVVATVTVTAVYMVSKKEKQDEQRSL